MSRKSKRIKNWSINIAIFLAVYSLAHFYQTRTTASGIAPQISGQIISAAPFRTFEEIEKPVLVHFWATWCRICEFEHDAINRISEDHSVLSIVSQSGNANKVKQYIEEKKITYPVLLDKYNHIAEDWGIRGFPTSFIVDEANQIRYTEVGLTSEWGLRFRLWLAKIF